MTIRYTSTVSYPPKDADQYEDTSNDHAYFAMMPNCIDDWLDPYEYRLYAHIKRVCGEKGRCWQSTETIAKTCRMSTGKVSQAKQTLVYMGLIAITEKKRKQGGRPYHHIRIVDIWNRNIVHCSTRPSSQDEQASSRDELKKTPLKEDPREGASAPLTPGDDSPRKETIHEREQRIKDATRNGAIVMQCPVTYLEKSGDPDQDATLWPDEPAETEPETPLPNPAQERLDRMRDAFGDDPVSVAAHCQQAQEAEGQWTVPRHKGLSPACAVFKEATGYRPAQAVREDIDTAIPSNEDALHNWYKVAHGWVMTGYSYKNVAGMLDWYAEGRVGRDKPKANGGSSGGKQPQPVPAFTFVEPDWLGVTA